MSETFTLYGKLLDRSGRPVVGAKVVLTGNPTSVRDNATDEIYTRPPEVTTDASGRLIREGSDTHGVPLVALGQYTIRPVLTGLFERVTFNAPAGGTTIDLADIIPDPLDLPASWHVTTDALAERITTLEAGGGGGGVTDHGALTGLGDDDHPHYLTVARGDARYPTSASVDAAFVAVQADVDNTAADLTAHETDTTTVHGIADTSALVLTNDARLSDARTPTTHTHDDRYFTEAETTTALGAKADASALTAHTSNTSNPHAVTKFQVGLSNVDNTADTAKPVSTAQQAALDASARVTQTQQAGTAYTLALTDAGTMVESTGSAVATFTVPTNAAVAFPIGTVVAVRQYGAGQVTIAAATDVIIRSRGAAMKTAAQYAELSLVKRATDEWVLTGDVVV